MSNVVSARLKPATEHSPRLAWLGPALLAGMTFIALSASLDNGGQYPSMPAGPGLTMDESFNVQEGARLVEGLQACAYGEISFRELFGDIDELGPNAPLGYHLPDHPPLGRLLLGVAHKVTTNVAPPRGQADQPFIVAAARSGSAFALALTTLLIGCVTARWYGRTAGVIAAIALPMMPRVFAHGHIAALESSIGLAYSAVVLAIAALWTRQSVSGTAAGSRNSPALKWALVTGILLGLAMLTKIQGALLPVPIALWALARWRLRAILPLLILGAVALAVFFALWPWLWLDPVAHFQEYLGRTTGRVPVFVWYFGERLADVDVPWHYPWVMFLVTVPIGLHLLGVVGLTNHARQTWTDPRFQLVIACLLFPLVLFSLPGVAVYDGTRLFLVSYPLWAIVIGKGGAAAWEFLRARLSKKVALPLFSLFLAAQTFGLWELCPCHLSYYNILVGGDRGAEKLGLETTYWGDSLTREFLEELVGKVPDGSIVAVAPVLHPFQLPAVVDQSPILREHHIQLVRLDQIAPDRMRYLLLFRRRADLPESMREPDPQLRLLAEVRRGGVQLTALYDLQPQP